MKRPRKPNNPYSVSAFNKKGDYLGKVYDYFTDPQGRRRVKLTTWGANHLEYEYWTELLSDITLETEETSNES